METLLAMPLMPKAYSGKRMRNCPFYFQSAGYVANLSEICSSPFQYEDEKKSVFQSE